MLSSSWWVRAGFGGSLLLAMGMYSYVRGVMLPIEAEHFLAMDRPVDVGDLYPRWHGTRELLLHGRNPYGPEVSGEIQMVYYGHPLDPTGEDRGRDEQRFAYPIYVVFFLAPTMWMSFPAVQELMRWTLGLLAIGSLLLWLRALRWRPSMVALLTLILMMLSSPALVQGIRLQQLAVLVAFFLALCAALVARGNLFWAGCLLAFATIKPQLALLPVIWFLVWATGDWKTRQWLVWGFGGMMALLTGAGEILLPGWVGEFLRGLEAYRHYVVMNRLLDAYMPLPAARGIAALILAALLTFVWLWRKGSAEQVSFSVRLSLVLAVAILTLPPLLPPFNQILLLPGLLVVIRFWPSLWEKGWMVRAVCCLGVGLVVLPGVIAGVLGVVRKFSPETELRGVWEWPFLLSFVLPPVVAGLAAMLAKDLDAQKGTPATR